MRAKDTVVYDARPRAELTTDLPLFEAVAEREVVLALHERRYKPLLDRLRWTLREFRRPVTADDVNDLLDRWRFPSHTTRDRRFVGQVFRANGWRHIGRVLSRRRRNHARPIEVWVYDGGG